MGVQTDGEDNIYSGNPQNNQMGAFFVHDGEFKIYDADSTSGRNDVDIDYPTFTPYFPHSFGRVPLRDLAQLLNDYILEQFGAKASIDLVGFSMGGVISRIWMQELGGACRTNRFISIGSPHLGTLTAQLVPKCLLPVSYTHLTLPTICSV